MKPMEDVSKRVVVRRRRFTQEFKRLAVKETLAAGASVAGIALKHRLNANVLFKWRNQYLHELASAGAKTVNLLPVSVEESRPALTRLGPDEIPGGKPGRQLTPRSCIQIDAFGARILLKGAVDAVALRTVLDALSQR
jgi:transposase